MCACVTETQFTMVESKHHHFHYDCLLNHRNWWINIPLKAFWTVSITQIMGVSGCNGRGLVVHVFAVPMHLNAEDI